MRRAALAIAVLTVGMLAVPKPAHAYRPFDATDAAVAEHGELELEVGPVGYLRANHKGHFAPAEVINYGVVPRLELVLQGRELLAPQPGSRIGLVDTGVFLKGVLREGCLQEKSGLSIATEVGSWLPTVNAEPGTGFSAALIFSQRWAFTTLHLNVQGGRTRAGNADLFGALIAEGPNAWRIRPVVELFADRELDTHITYSALAGFIARVSDEFALDAGGRAATTDANRVFEVRAGFTWAIPLGRVGHTGRTGSEVASRTAER